MGKTLEYQNIYFDFDSIENPYVYVVRLAMNLDVCIPTTPTHVICNKTKK